MPRDRTPAAWKGLAAALAIVLSAGAARSEPYVWKNVTVGGGGFMPDILFSPVQPGLAYLRSDMGGIYRWEAAKHRWRPLQDDQAEGSYQGVESVAPDPVDPNRVYAAVGIYRLAPAAILRSDDRGDHWRVFPVPFRMGGNEDGRGVGERLALDPNQPSILYFGSRHDGLQRSEDRGAHWSKVASFPLPGLGAPPPYGPTHTGLSFVLFDAKSGHAGTASRTIIVGSADPGPQHLFRSDDAGAHWRAVAGGPSAKLAPVKAALDARGELYVAYSDNAGPNGARDGAVWRLDLSSGEWRDITPDKRPDRPAGGYMGISLDRQHPGTLVVSTLNRVSVGDTVWRTTDDGAHWTSLKEISRQDVSATPWLLWGKDQASFGWWMAALAIDPFDPDTAAYATGATVYATHDLAEADKGRAVTWSPWVEGVEQTAILNLTSPPTGPHLISGFGDIGGFVHDDLDRTPPSMFTNPTFDNTNNIDVAGLNPKVVVRSGEHHDNLGPVLAYSEDGGRSWRPLEAPRPAAVPPNPYPGRRWGRTDPYKDAAIVASADGATIMVMLPTPIISRDKGRSWQAVKGLSPYDRPVPDKADPSRFYALDFKSGDLLTSTDGGASFTRAPTRGLPADLRADRPTWREEAWPLMATPGRAGDLWFVSRQGLYHRRGAAFERVASDISVEVLAFGAPPPGKTYPALFAIGRQGDLLAIWRSDDQGRSWVRINDDAHEYGRRFRCIAGDPRIYGRVYVGTDGRGILYGDLKNGETSHAQ